MIAAGYPAPARQRTNSRQAQAFRAGEQELNRQPHSIGLLLYYKYLVARAGYDSSSLLEQAKLANDNSVSVRTIRRYDDHLVTAGLIWRVKEGHSYRRYIVAYEPMPACSDAEISAPPEIVALEREPFFFAPRTGQIDPVEPDRSIPLYPLTGSRVNQGEALRPAGDTRLPETGNAETVELLTDLGCFPETTQKLSHIAPETVRETIDQADRCGRARDRAAFVAHALQHGGVYGSKRDRQRRPRDAAPMAPQPEFETTPDPPSVTIPDPLPSICPTCGRWCQAEWHGHCPTCEPDEFEVIGGEP